MEENTKQHRAEKLEAILAREVVDLAARYKDDAGVQESITEICFTLQRLLEEIGYASLA